MTKIIIVGPASPLRGGISDFNEALAKSLTVNGYLVEIISFSLQHQLQQLNRPLEIHKIQK